jgi:hypothetical protein
LSDERRRLRNAEAARRYRRRRGLKGRRPGVPAAERKRRQRLRPTLEVVLPGELANERSRLALQAALFDSLVARRKRAVVGGILKRGAYYLPTDRRAEPWAIRFARQLRNELQYAVEQEDELGGRELREWHEQAAKEIQKILKALRRSTRVAYAAGPGRRVVVSQRQISLLLAQASKVHRPLDTWASTEALVGWGLPGRRSLPRAHRGVTGAMDRWGGTSEGPQHQHLEHPDSREHHRAGEISTLRVPVAARW